MQTETNAPLHRHLVSVSKYNTRKGAFMPVVPAASSSRIMGYPVGIALIVFQDTLS
jgi:hypothetical protein